MSIDDNIKIFKRNNGSYAIIRLFEKKGNKLVHSINICDAMGVVSIYPSIFPDDVVKGVKGSNAFLERVVTHLDSLSLDENGLANLLYSHVYGGVEDVSTLFGILERSHHHVRQSDADCKGLVCLYGGSGSGKTTFVNSLRDTAMTDGLESLVHVFHTSEPVSYAVPLANAMLNYVIDALVAKDTSIFVVDSLRGVVYGSGGATLSGGMSAAMLEIVMNMSRFSDALGVTTFAVINPLNKNDERNETLIEALNGSASGIILFRAEDRDSFDITHRNWSDRSLLRLNKSDVIRHLLLNTGSLNMTRTHRSDVKENSFAASFNVTNSRPLIKTVTDDLDLQSQLLSSVITDVPPFNL